MNGLSPPCSANAVCCVSSAFLPQNDRPPKLHAWGMGSFLSMPHLQLVFYYDVICSWSAMAGFCLFLHVVKFGGIAFSGDIAVRFGCRFDRLS